VADRDVCGLIFSYSPSNHHRLVKLRQINQHFPIVHSKNSECSFRRRTVRAMLKNERNNFETSLSCN